MRRGIAAGLLAIFATAGTAAQSTDPQAILKSARGAYSGLKNFRIEAVVSMESSGENFENVFRSKMLIAGEQSGKFRVESKTAAGYITVFDGTETWNYNGSTKRYFKTGLQPTPASPLTTAGVGLFGDSPGKTLQATTLAGVEDLSIGGTPYKTYVLDLTYRSNGTGGVVTEQRLEKVWIDQNTYLVVKRISWQHIKTPATEMDMKSTTAVEAFTVNAPFPKDFFAFVPPPGAILADSPFPASSRNSGAISSLISKKSPDFALKDLEGKEYLLSSYQGKVVLLDFCASWCKPCRALMPALETLKTEFGGAVFLAIDVGEAADKVREFRLDTKIGYPVLLGGDHSIAAELHAESLPTIIVIDKDGVVRSHLVGYSADSEVRIRAALRDATQPEKRKEPLPLTPPPPPLGPEVTVHTAGGGVTAPSVISKVDPQYSEEARKARISGSVLLSLVVGPDGLPRDIKVVRPLGSHLDENAVETVNQWKFKAGTKNGRPVAVQATIEVNFRLLDNPASTAPSDSDLERNPVTAEEAYRRGERLFRTRHLPEAIAVLDKAVALNPSWADPFAARARVQVQSKRYSEAIDDYSEAIRLNPQKPGWYDERGLAYSYSGRHARAIEDYSRAITLAPNIAVYYSNRGWAYSETGDPATAIKDLTKAIELSPDYSPAFQNRASAYAKLKDWNHAIADETAAIQLSPTTWLYERRADAKRAMGDSAGANEDMLKGAAIRTPLRSTGQTIGANDANLPAPKLIAPAENAILDVYPRQTIVTWEPSAGAASYLVEWDYSYNGLWNSEDRKLALPFVTTQTTNAAFNFVGAQPGRWRVVPVNASGQRGASSEWRHFRYTK